MADTSCCCSQSQPSQTIPIDRSSSSSSSSSTMTSSSSDIFSVPFVGDINKNYSNLFRLTPIPVNKITVTTPDLLPASTHLLFSRDTVKTRTDPNDTGAGTLQSLETTKQRSRIRPAWSVTGVATGGSADQLESDLSLTLDNAFTTHRESTDTLPTSDTSRLGFLLRATHAIPIGNTYQHLQPSMIADINYVHGINADAESSIHAEHHSTDKSCEYRLRMPTSTLSTGLIHDVSSKVHRAFVGGTHGVWRDGNNDAVVGAKITSTPFLTQFQRWDHSPIIPVTSSTTSTVGQHLIPGIESMAVTGLLRHPSTNLTFDTNLEISGADLHLKDWHIRGSYQQEKWCGGLQVGVPPDPADVRTGTTLAQKLNTIGSWPIVTGDLIYNITSNDIFRIRASSDASISYLYRRILSPSLSVSTNVNIHRGKGGNEATLGVGVFVG